MGCGCSNSSVNKFLGMFMSNIKSSGHVENSFLHFDTLAFQNSQNANRNELAMEGAFTWQSPCMSLYQSLILLQVVTYYCAIIYLTYFALRFFRIPQPSEHVVTAICELYGVWLVK